MRRSQAFVALVLGILVVAGAALSASQRRILPPGAAFIGQVVDADTGVGLRRAIVDIGGAGLQRRVVSDDRGRFLFTGLPAGAYHITASRTGYLTGAHGQRRPSGAATIVTVNTGQWIGALDVRLWKPGVITGDVRDAHGDPAVGVTVRAYRHERDAGHVTLREAAVSLTDDRGQYRLASLVPGDHLVGISSLTSDVSQPPPAVDPASDDVRLDEPTYPPAHVFPPQYYPSTEQVAGAARVPVQAGREYFGVSFLLPSTPAFTVSGRLETSTPTDVGSIQVPLLLTRPSDPTITEHRTHRVLAVTTTDAEGRFTFSQVPSGRFEIEAAATGTTDGTYWAKEAVTVTNTAVTNVIVTMRSGLDVQGRLRVVSRDRRVTPPLGRVVITFQPLFDAPGVGEVSATIDETGTFRTGPSLTPGPYLVRVAVPPGFMLRAVMSGGLDVADHPLDLSSGFAATDLEVTLTDQRTSVLGTVRGEGPFGDPTATVLLFPPDAGFGQRGGGARRFRSVRTTREGTFTIRDLPPGAYLAVAVDDADVEGWQEPARLQHWRTRAIPLSIREGEAKVIELRRLVAR